MACDSCTLLDGTPELCPGDAVHCARGEHCTSTGADCAACVALDDHAKTCCLCGGILS